MKIYVSSYNGVLEEYKSQVEYAPPLDADKMVLWQDTIGSPGKLVEMSRKFFPKPIYTMQHGRRASRDYDAPLKRKFNSDLFLAWGKWDYDNMTRLGYKTEIVGCPLNTWIKPKVEHKEKVILFVPVNTGKEEPDNINVYIELQKIKLDMIQQGLMNNYEPLRAQWDVNKISRGALSNDFTLLAKSLPWHDNKFYTEGVIKGVQASIKNNQILFDLLRNVDLVVGLDEGTTELFAAAHDVPIIVVDGFEYRWTEHGGARVKPPVTPGITHCRLEDLKECVERALAHPEELRQERRALAENEMSLDSIPNPIARLHEIIGSR